MVQMRGLSKELQEWFKTIRAKAVAHGLDFYEVVFEMVEPDEVNEIAALGGFPQYGGFPNRYPHWRFGMEYDRLSKSYAYGLSKIYEMVINTDPCYAYLLTSNSVAEQKLVMAHVYGHADFFKNNYYFAHTNRKMIDEMANHAVRVRRYQDLHGVDRVEEFIDACLSIDNLVDLHAPAIRRTPAEEPVKKEPELTGSAKAKSYLDKFVNPTEPSKTREEEDKEEEARNAPKKFPEHPVPDVLGFLLEHAPLKPWQQDYPKRSRLLCAASSDQDHERRLGKLLALEAYDGAFAYRLRSRRLCRCAQRYHGHTSRWI